MKKMAIGLGVLLSILAVVLGIFSPKTTILPIFLLIFTLGYAAVCLFVAIVLRWVYPKMTKSRLTFASCVLAFCPVVIVALQSVGGLSILNFILALTLPIVLVWYVFKRNLTS